MTLKKTFLRSFLAITIILGLSLCNNKLTLLSAQDAVAAPSVRTDAIVLVNHVSPDYADFQHFIQPYLDNFGIPYTLLDIANTAIGSNISDYAVIIIGHRSLDVDLQYLDLTEQSYITSAVSAGTGLINFDNHLASNYIGYYQFIQNIFAFDYIHHTYQGGVRFVTLNYVTGNHLLNEEIATNSEMDMASITLAASDTALAISGTQPFLTITNYGQGHAVQWGTYDWMSINFKGPVYGLDDLVWRSIVWAARKPFVMQGMPPFVTVRVDDVAGPMGWANIATELGYKPWLGLFYQDIDTSEAAALSALAHAGKITTSIHAKTSTDFFYFDHYSASNFSDSVMTANYAEATAFLANNNIPISKYGLPHFYEIGTNAFQGLSNWGIEFIGTHMLSGNPYSSNWVNLGPYRLYETGSSSGTQPVYYADYLTIPGHPEYNNQFFNCVTEIRDDAGYEWYPSTDVEGTVGRGTRQTVRALDSMVLATLFTHEYYLQGIDSTSWQAILEGIKTNLKPYGPIYVTMDFACQYARAIHNSNISAGSYDLGLNILTTSLSGSTDTATKFYVFTQEGDTIRQIMVDVPAFNGSTVVNFTMPGALDHIVITPASATIIQGGTQVFSAMGYDVNNNPIPNLPIRWNVVNGGGVIDMDGVFTASGDPGSYPNTIQATYNGFYGYASATIANVGVVTGWNMVSVPVQAANMQLNVLFPDIIPPAYYFTTAYQEVQGTDTLVTGRGYWMYFTTAHTYSIPGQPVSPQDIPVNSGWNMIGPFDHSVQVSAITSTPAGILIPPLYGYTNGYSEATTLQPGAGYWAYATQSGTLHLGGGGGLAAGVLQPLSGNRNSPQDFRLPVEVSSGRGIMTVVVGASPQGSADYDAGLDQLAPPPSPAGAFDVRLANEGEHYLVDVRNSQPGEYTFTLLLSPGQEGEDIVLRWDAESLAGLGKFEIVDLVGGELYALVMSTVGELVIQPGSVLYSGLQIRVKTDQPRYPLFLPVLVH